MTPPYVRSRGVLSQLIERKVRLSMIEADWPESGEPYRRRISRKLEQPAAQLLYSGRTPEST